MPKDRTPLPLTTEEVVAAIRNRDRKGNPAPDETYALYAKVAQTKMLPEGCPGLEMFDQWCVDPAAEEFEDRVWRIDLSLMTGETTGYRFPVRTLKLGRRVALKNTPGYSWLVEPHIDAGHAGYMSSMSGCTFSVDNDKEGRIVITAARANAPSLADLKVVAFEEGGQRHEFAQDRLGGPLGWTSPDTKLVVQRFHLEPGLAGKIRYWGIEIAPHDMASVGEKASAAAPAWVRHNILKNSGVEAGDRTPDDWQQGPPVQGVTYSWCKTAAFEGYASLCIEKTAQSYSPIAQWSQTVDRPANLRSMAVSAQVKAENKTQGMVDVSFLDASGKLISRQCASFIGRMGPQPPRTTHDWTLYSGRVEIPPQAKKLSIGLQLFGPGKVWFDNI